MRKLFSLVLVVALVFALSVNAFAALDLTNSFYKDAPFLVPNDDGDTLFGVLPTSQCDDATREYLSDFFSVLSGNSSNDDFYYVFATSYYDGILDLWFVVCPTRLNISCDANSNLSCNAEYARSLYATLPSSASFSLFGFRFDPSSGVFSNPSSCSSVRTVNSLFLGRNTTSRFPVYPNKSEVSALVWCNHSDPLTFESVSHVSITSPLIAPASSNICKSCLCLRCHSISCKYEKFYNCYPTNAGCVYCLMQENEKPVIECDGFQPRKRGEVFKIKLRSKNRYSKIAKLLFTLHSEFKRLQ